MRVNPPYSAAGYLALPDELDYFRMCDQRRLTHHSVLGENFWTRSAVTDEQLPVNEIVPEHLIVG